MTEHVLITNIGGHYSLGGVQKEFATVSGLVTYCRSSKFVDIQLDHLLYADWQRLVLLSQYQLTRVDHG